MKKINVTWDSERSGYYVSEPCWDGGDVYLTSEVDARIAEMEKYKRAVDEHNESCQARCGIGDQEAVSCKYRPYFVSGGRRCPTCPVHEKIEL